MKPHRLWFWAVVCAAALLMAGAVTAQAQGQSPINEADFLAQVTAKGRAVGLTNVDIIKLKEAAQNGGVAAGRRYPKEEKSPLADQILGKEIVTQLKAVGPEQRQAGLQRALSNPATLKKSQEAPIRGKPQGEPDSKKPF